MTQTITRSDGIVYERRTKKGQYDTKIQIRLTSEQVDKLKTYAEKENIKYTALIREMIEDFIERECK
jgi:predicted DNA binding CopG/RHH family protein